MSALPVRLLDTRAQDRVATFRRHLAPLLALGEKYPDATELIVDGSLIALDLGNSWLEFGFSDFPGLTERDIEAAARAAATNAGIQFGAAPPAEPAFSVKIPPDLRVSIIIPPASDVSNLCIRFLRSRSLTLADYVEQGVMSVEQSWELREALHDHQTMIVSGQTSSGKTTMLRALIQIAVDAGERVLIIEDTPELNVPGKRVLHWATTLQRSMSDLLRQALRHRPDRIVVGEVRGPEALELVRATNTGHAGLLATLHSNGGDDTMRRLFTLVCEAQPNFQMAGVKSAIDLDVHLTGRGSERRLAPLHHFKR